MTNHSRPFYKSLYFRFGASFFLVIVLSSILQQYFTIRAWEQLSHDLTQRLHWDLAADIDERLQPALRDAYDKHTIEQKLFDIQAIQPDIKIYLLDSSGNILEHFGSDTTVVKKKVSIEPIKKALSLPTPTPPLLGDDPISLEPDGQNIFSVTKTRINGRPGYLYVVLRSQTAEVLTRIQGQLYVFAMIAAFSGTTILLSLIAGFFLFSLLSKNLRNLMAAVAAFEKGDLESRAVVANDDEVGDLAAAINRMAQTIKENIETMASNDRLRRDLIANISHDLRSPLTVIDGYIDVLVDDYELHSEEQRKKFLQIVKRNLEGQKRLVSDLFELSKLEAKERQADLQACPLSEFFEDLHDKYQESCREKGVTITYESSPDQVTCLADPDLLYRIFSNLIENAIRYTPEGGAVRLEATQENSMVSLSVADSGIGIPASEVPLVFDSFYRVDKGRSKQTGGTGLGLTIVKKMVEALGSEIKLESVEGEGAIFSFFLPVVREA